jgi:tetratricopeptide (TPR) repeat protein
MLPSETPPDGGGGRDGLPLWARAAIGIFCSAVLVGALAFWLWPERAATAPEDHDDEDLDQALAVVNPGYVGIATCAGCHAERAAEFRTTRHFVACTTAAGVKAPGFTPQRGRYAPGPHGLRFEMTRSGDDFFMTSVQPVPDGERRVRHKIGLVYGSANQRDEFYFAWQEDELFALPVSWLYSDDCWGHSIDPRRPVPAPPSCLECHNTWVEHVPGTPNRYRRDDMLLGVTCERCHGPGREHAAYHREHPKARSHAILHPGTLSRDRLMDVCAQCHGNVRNVGLPFSYRPGQPLATAYHTAKASRREDETTSNQVQYLAQSKCFQKSKMTCVTCHEPHWPQKPAEVRRACLNCHKPDSCPDRPNQPEAVRSDCVGCHAPSRVWMNSHYYTTANDRYLPIGTRAEHRIAVYPEARQAVLLAHLRKQTDPKSRAEADRAQAKLSEHWLKEAERLERAGRLRAAIGAYREALRVTPSGTARQRMQEAVARQAKVDDLMQAAEDAAQGRIPGQAVGLLREVLRLEPGHARAHGLLGSLHADSGRRDEAVEHLEAVARCDPNDSSGLARLAWMEFAADRPEQAVARCAQADRVEPGRGANHHLWGMALLKLERWEEAEEQFRKTLLSGPTHAGANRGLSEALLRQGQTAEAVRFARRAERCSDRPSAEILLTLGEAYAAARRVPEARRALEQAQAIAQREGSPLRQTIRDRLRRLE